MKRVKVLATQLGLGIGTTYCFFLIPSVAGLFSPSFLILVKQCLAISFAACLLISPESLVDLGSRIAPKIISMFGVMFGNNKSNKDES